MIIREMNRSDIEGVRKVAIHTWRDTYSSFIPSDIQKKTLKEAYSTETMVNRLMSFVTLVAEMDRKIIGYAFFSGGLENKDIFLESLYVHPNYQGKGVGMQLFKTGLQKFKGPETISLTVYKGNSNITFYEKQGFKVIKEKKSDFSGHPMIFILMKKDLKSPN